MMRARHAPTDTPPPASQRGDLGVDGSSDLADARAEVARRSVADSAPKR
ncbi:MAG: hypothetical protein ACRDVN_02155 [Jiangellaceae bacterium]